MFDQEKSATGSALIPAATRAVSTETVQGLDNYAKTGAPTWFGELLKFNGKNGLWTSGKDAIPVEDGRQLAAVVPEMLAGYMLWKDGELVDQAWMPAAKFDARKQRPTLGDLDQSLWPCDENGAHVDPWKEAVMLPLIDPDTREEFTFSSSSVGGVRAAKRLATAYVKQMLAAPATTQGCLPIVALGSQSYKHTDKKRGTIYNPVFEGMDWVLASSLLPGSNNKPQPDTAPPTETPKLQRRDDLVDEIPFN
jgi:hypothetical protein